MESNGSVPKEVSVVSFDLYDTLLDRMSVLVPAIQRVLGKETGLDPGVFCRRYLAMHFRDSLIDSLIPGEHTPFKEISRCALRYRLEEADIHFSSDDVDHVLHAWQQLDPYPKVDEILGELQNSYSLVGLSNGDPDMLDAVRSSFSVELDSVISVAEAGAYKPHPAPYHTLLDRFDIAPEEALFVSAHTFDIVGAKAVGMRGCYLNRHAKPYGDWPHQPNHRIDSITELPKILGN